MWERLAKAAMNYTRPFGRPPKSRAGMRRFMDPRGRLKGVRLQGARVLGLAAGGGWDPVIFAKLGAPTIEFGNRFETIVNGMVAGGMVVDGIWEFSPGPAEPDAEPGSEAHLDTLFPAFIEVRGRKLAVGAPLRTLKEARSAVAAKGTSRPRGR